MRRDPLIKEGEWHPIHFGADRVGESKYSRELIDFGGGDRIYRTTVTEKIQYGDDYYQFEFTLIDEVTKITILRYDPKRDLYYLSDSYTIIFDGGSLKHLYYENDGETVRSERVISDPTKVNYAKDLFRKVQKFVLGYYAGYIYEKPEDRFAHYDRIQSLGYELLKYDRL